MSRAHAAFIPGDQLGAVTDWNFGAVDQASLRFAAKLQAQAAREEKVKDDSVRQAGFTEGYSQGYAQGHAQATLEGQRQITEYISTQGAEAAANLAQLFGTAQAQLMESQQAMAKGVLELACELARQVLRHELSANPNALQPVIREALGMLSTDTKAAAVRMNPVDIEVFEDTLREEFAGLALNLVVDASITRGGCLVESAGTVVDGSVERRWQKAVASLGLESAWEDANDIA
jgi:flagellar assembly protein FliH